ncbi:hypothetical protein Tco_0268149 [Tanacetum coccineum]
MSWVLDVKVYLKSMGVAQIIIKNNDSPSQDKEKENIILRKHIDDGLKFEYLPTETQVFLGNILRITLTIKGKFYFRLFEKNGDLYDSKTLKMSMSTPLLCLELVHTLNYKFTIYSKLDAYLLVVEHNNELLMNNHESCTTKSLAHPEVNATKNDANSFMHRQGQSHGKGHG